MNKATAKTQEMKVRFYGSNKHADYYKINETHTVIHNVQAGEPFTCLDDRLNACDHIEALKDHLQEHRVAA